MAQADDIWLKSSLEREMSVLLTSIKFYLTPQAQKIKSLVRNHINPRFPTHCVRVLFEKENENNPNVRVNLFLVGG